ncbi:HAMP domain-containing sensor histidine kinase [Citroniella saccharovorans]|uniref:histidine kinase n=1 Tax=Citroniella saccharovorans TaxID=2053367 RepID=A0AAW9MV43_9FIRM|nr:HAMP domain-containing sensor histidine kinase [Citroniella saccharovorans]MEB3428803.1 HAMP domain-containing sensor histidine kinase [Citroniella saccharovorans]
MLKVFFILSLGLNIGLGLILFILFKDLKKTIGLTEEYLKEEKSNMRVNSGSFKISLEISKLINKLIEKNEETKKRSAIERENLNREITSISHDIRTPLTSIIGYIQLSKDECREDKINHYLSIIEKKSYSLEELINDFYSLKLIETKKDLEMQKVYPNIILEELISEYYVDFEKKGIKLDDHILSNKSIFTNEKYLFRSFENLISNMLKFTKSKAEISHFEKNGRLYTVFKNDIKNDSNLVKDKIFTKYYTEDHARVKRSSGLGLYSTKLMLNRSGEKIDVNFEGDYIIFTISYKDSI